MNILFFSHDGKLGDAVLHTYFVNEVKKQNKNNQVYCITANGTKEFWNRDNRIDKSWNLDQPSFFDIIKLGIEIRKYKIDYVFMWTKPKSEKIKLLNWLIHPKKGIHFFTTSPSKHAINRGIEALNKLNISTKDKPINYSIDINNWQPYQVDKNAIYLNLFSTCAARSITLNDAIQIIENLTQDTKRIIYITYTNSDNEFIEKLKLLLKPKQFDNVKWVYTQNNLSQLMWLCYSVALIITPDTSITHIASAFNKPIITLFKKENSYLQIQWAPISDKKESIIFFDIEETNEKQLAIKQIIHSAKIMLNDK